MRRLSTALVSGLIGGVTAALVATPSPLALATSAITAAGAAFIGALMAV